MAKKREYLVTWTIDVEARSPKEAAKKALKIQRDPTSVAVVFQVRAHGSPDTHRVDLDPLEGEGPL